MTPPTEDDRAGNEETGTEWVDWDPVHDPNYSVSAAEEPVPPPVENPLPVYPSDVIEETPAVPIAMEPVHDGTVPSIEEEPPVEVPQVVIEQQELDPALFARMLSQTLWPNVDDFYGYGDSFSLRFNDAGEVVVMISAGDCQGPPCTAWGEFLSMTGTIRTEIAGGKLRLIFAWNSDVLYRSGTVTFIFKGNGVLEKTVSEVVHLGGSRIVTVQDFDASGSLIREREFRVPRPDSPAWGEPNVEALHYCGTAYPAYQRETLYFYELDSENRWRIRIEISETQRGGADALAAPPDQGLTADYRRDPQQTVTQNHLSMTFLVLPHEGQALGEEALRDWMKIYRTKGLLSGGLASGNTFYHQAVGSFRPWTTRPLEASLTRDYYQADGLHYLHEEHRYRYEIGTVPTPNRFQNFMTSFTQEYAIEGWRLSLENEKSFFRKKYIYRVDPASNSATGVTETYNFVHYGCRENGKTTACSVDPEKPYEVVMTLTPASLNSRGQWNVGVTQNYNVHHASSLLANVTGIDDSLVDMIRDMATARVEESETDASDPVEGRKFMVYERNESGHMVLTRIYYLLANGSIVRRTSLDSAEVSVVDPAAGGDEVGRFVIQLIQDRMAEAQGGPVFMFRLLRPLLDFLIGPVWDWGARIRDPLRYERKAEADWDDRYANLITALDGWMKSRKAVKKETDGMEPKMTGYPLSGLDPEAARLQRETMRLELEELMSALGGPGQVMHPMEMILLFWFQVNQVYLAQVGGGALDLNALFENWLAEQMAMAPRRKAVPEEAFPQADRPTDQTEKDQKLVKIKGIQKAPEVIQTLSDQGGEEGAGTGKGSE
ncbi:MAG: hypothetical protein ACOY3K_03450 [Candidatus Omnitrophota bacterium]